MGATTFRTKSSGRTAEEAFRRAVDEACWAVGHGGSSGTIAEKENFVVIEVPACNEPEQYAEQLLEIDDPRVRDKWGPAGAVQIGIDEWLFFGWAIS